jgi:hypothetical protein
VAFHCLDEQLLAALADEQAAMRIETGTVTSAMSASNQEIQNIIPSTAMTVSSE